MKAIFVCDNNPFYSDFWEPMANHMKRVFNLDSILYYLTNETSHTLFTSDFASVITIPLLENIPKLLQALLAKWYFPALIESEEPILICDIDCFLLSKEYIANIQKETTLFHLAPYDNNKVPGYYVYGTPGQLKEFFQLGSQSFYDFCTMIMHSEFLTNLQENQANQFNKDASPDWKYFCTEERYAYACSILYKHPKRNTVQHPMPDINRICRSQQSTYDINALLRGFYIDYHCPRPYAAYRETIQAIITKI